MKRCSKWLFQQLVLVRAQIRELELEYELAQTERCLLALEKRLAFRNRFPDSVESILASNYSAQKFLSAIDQSSGDGLDVRNRKLEQLVSFFPGTVAAKKAGALLH